MHHPARRTALVLTAAGIALTATACAPSSSGDHTPARATHTASPTPTAEPALTKKQALAHITHYSKINNQANADHDRQLLDTIEDGPLYAMSVADYTQDEGLPKADREKYKPWSYNLTATDVYIPRFLPGQQRWFAAVTYSGKNNKYARVLIMAEQPGTKRWEMVAAVDVDDKKQLPKIALDADGYAAKVDATSTKNVAAPVDVLRASVLDNFATGGDMSGKKVFATTKTFTRQIKVHDDTIHKFGSRGTTEFASAATEFPDSYALKTTDGGALVVFAHTHTQRDAVAHSGLQIVPEKEDRAWLGSSPRESFTYTFTCSDVAAAPATPDKSQLLGYTCRRTDAHGRSAF
ncbi:hypothetical protein [Streptomyces sp. JV178]|uniref:hypothetical protein n=1 Tax=Streptomyces sp. JV178 TaxID=858632 RepID=UPI00211DCDEB|nr:hypothetical protein [Streptomyces sp. JV178]